MSDYQVADGSLGGQPIDENSTTLQNNLGRCVSARDMATTDYGFGEFVYLKGLDATIVGTAVTFNYGDHATALAVANAVGLVGIAMAATVTGEYGWYQIKGRAVCEVLTGFAADKVPYLTATAGELDDAVVAGDLISGSISQSAIATPAAGQAEISICYPYVTNASN
jgi:hypothetical protein